jgi:Putative MetA-pathway of phenol degradation
MTRQKVTTILGVVLACACVAKAGFAQTQATTTNGTQTSGGQDQSAAAMAQEAANPFSSRWLLQMQQNNNWMDMPRESGDRMQSNLMFQPLMSVALSEKWGLYVRPVVTIVNSLPHLDQNDQSERTNGFGDTVLGVAAARPLFGGRLMLGAGPTFAFPTASARELGQDTWQIGPDVGATLLGKNFIAYAFVQQWFKVGGDGRDTNQMNGVFNFTYTFANGYTIGSQPSLSVDWKASEDNRVAFAIGPQIGKLCRCGGVSTLMQLQLQYYPVRPSVGGPKWNIQLQVTPTVPALIKKTLF